MPPKGARKQANGAQGKQLSLQERDPPVSPGPILREGEPAPNIYLFVPNLIGYLRIVLAAVALTYMSYHPKYCTTTYFVSCILDAVDGHAARMLGQTSRFGAILDMVTDRCTTSCLLCFLSSAYPRYALLFQGLIALDFSSHYIHMYSSLTGGSKSHKRVDREQSRILWWYYNDQRVLFSVCAANETFFVCLYLMKWYQRPLGLDPVALLRPFPPALVKYLPPSAHDEIRRFTVPLLVGLITAPVCALKQAINVVQIYRAAQALNESDIQEWRARGRQSRAS